MGKHPAFIKIISKDLEHVLGEKNWGGRAEKGKMR